MLVFERQLTTETALYRSEPSSIWTCLQQFRVDFQIEDPSVLEWQGKVNLRHRGSEVSFTGAVGVAIRATLRYSPNPIATPPASSVDVPYYNSSMDFVTRHGKAACNIASIDDHYADLITFGRAELSLSGYYRLEFWGTSHSTGAPNTDGIVCVNINNDWTDAVNPYSYLIAKVI
jgi:hypothetical protein